MRCSWKIVCGAARYSTASNFRPDTGITTGRQRHQYPSPDLSQGVNYRLHLQSTNVCCVVYRDTPSSCIIGCRRDHCRVLRTRAHLHAVKKPSDLPSTALTRPFQSKSYIICAEILRNISKITALSTVCAFIETAHRSTWKSSS